MNQAKLEAHQAEKAQLDQELMGHKRDREAAQQDLDKATAIRDKEHADYETTHASGRARVNVLAARSRCLSARSASASPSCSWATA